MRRSIFLAAIAAAVISCSTAVEEHISVVPYPNEVTVKNGTFDAAGADIRFSADLDQASQNVIRTFADQLALVTGQASTLNGTGASTSFNFICEASMPEEAYTLNINNKTATVKASSLRGFNYAIQTIKQMLPAEIFGKAEAADKDWALQCVEIKDEPRFGYRGMHMDVSRHFFDMDMVKKYLDVMEIHKLNTLHWHLTDDQGWRVEIKQYPLLTEIGSIRKETLVGHLHRGEGVYDGTRYGEGCWFSQEQVKEIIDYAAAKGIEIIPEIDLPGHMLAALAAYPQYGCTGGPYDVWGRWGIADDVLCAGNEETMVFLENILAEIAALFPSEYVHIGGDECPKVRWEKCRHCQAKIRKLGLKDEGKYKAEHYLQSYVMERMTNFLSAKGKKVIGWDEILEGSVAKDAIVMSWRGTSGGIQAAKMGHDVIMTPNTYYYIDYYQSLDIENEPLGIGGYLPVEKCYSYEPYAEEMSEAETQHILGVQANLWTEYIATNSHLEYMLLPRLAALSEVQWCNADRKCWNRFLDAADNFCAIYDTMGYNYAKHIFDVKATLNIVDGKITASFQAQGDADIRYTLDGTEPTAKSKIYKKPLTIEKSCTLKAKAFYGENGTKTYSQEFQL
ncbi:MAG: family 20 glycosylhydrolase, partial [Bacteroidales bacterium]|nr:family 20 glycosylhydrolase [Bacteroidales bacterium]